MELVITVAAAVLRLCLCIFLLRSLFPLQMPVLWKRILILAAAAAALGGTSVVLDHFAVQAGILVIVAAVLCWFFCRSSIGSTVLFSLAMGALQLMACAVSRFLGEALSAGSVTVCLFECIILYALCGVCAAMGHQWRSGPEPILWMIPMWLAAIVLCVEVIRTEEASLSGKLFSGLWLGYMGIRLWDVGNRVDARVRQRMTQQQKAHHYAQQEEYFLQLQEKQSQTRALWHDLNKYLKAAKAEYADSPALERLETALSDATQITDVGNRVINVILNEYAQTAKAAMIELRLRVQVPPELSVEVADMYVLIGNTMDNAIEACRAMPTDQRIIELTLRTHYDILYYKLVNPYDPRNRREEDPMRGYGLQNVRHCVERYRGSIETSKENGFFILTAHLNM